MTSKERAKYFSELWPAACLANEWDVKDDARRRAVTAECMRLVRGPEVDSASQLGPDEVTALFCYLAHLADGASLDKSARWATCQEDYHTFNRARQADWHERSLYGPGRNKLDRQRFAGETSAAGGPLDTLDRDQVRKRHMTMASRHQAKVRQERRENPLGFVGAGVAATNLHTPPPPLVAPVRPQVQLEEPAPF